MSTLRSKVIRLAHAHVELRPLLLPMLKEADALVDNFTRDAQIGGWKPVPPGKVNQIATLFQMPHRGDALVAKQFGGKTVVLNWHGTITAHALDSNREPHAQRFFALPNDSQIKSFLGDLGR